MPRSRCSPLETLEPLPGLFDSTLHGSDLACHQDTLESRGVGVLEVGKGGLLGEVADVPRAQDRPLGGLELTDQGSHQRGLARSVPAHQTHPVP